MSTFNELAAGNGRLYPLTAEEKEEVVEGNKKRGKEYGQDWLVSKPANDFNGFIKLDQNVIDFMQAGVTLSEQTGEECRIRYEGYRAKKQDGSPQLNLESAYIKGVGALKKFDASTIGQAPKKNSVAQAQKAEPVEMFDEEDDLPF